MIKKLFLQSLLLPVLLSYTTVLLAEDVVTITSPDKQIRFTVSRQGRDLYYTITANGITVIQSSPFVMKVDDVMLSSPASIGKPNNYSIHETYPIFGAHTIAHNDCNGIKIPLVHAKGTDTLDIRVFNTGVAFRFISKGSDQQQRIPGEATVFTIPQESKIWYHDLNGHYEGVHVKRQIDTIQQGQWAATPVTFKLPGGAGYASIAEADLKEYAGMALQTNGKHGLVIRLANEQPVSHPYELRYSKEDVARLAKPAVITGTITTPWRVIMIGKDLNAMVNNDIIYNLCPPPDPQYFPQGIHTSWIKPGRAVWKYLDGGGEGTPETMRRFTDEAAQLGFEHNILEGFWSKWPDSTLQNFTAYSNSKHISIWVWAHSKTLRDSAARNQFWLRCRNMGIAGAKIDFFDHEAKEVIDLYQAILKESAQYHLMVDFHGSNKPTGMSRTWPNEMTREAVKGMEASKLEDRATHETTIPFTRLLAGPAEYTVMHFGERRRNTTWAHQVASAVVLGGAPMLTYATNPENILNNPAVNIIKQIPSYWEETIVLPGSEIGEMAAYARRKGNTWFVAVMNGKEARTIRISLAFLGSGKYNASIAEDVAGNSAAITMHEAVYSSKDTIELSLTNGGGYIAMFEQ